ncbi:MAG: hypothetical protein O2992_03490 [Gemmatimonadetes bacterium]|nr:hypothetical protein [Gemmatimonadota bacterium]
MRRYATGNAVCASSRTISAWELQARPDRDGELEPEQFRADTDGSPHGPDLGAFAALAAMFGFGGGGNLLPTSAGTHRATWGLTYAAPTLPAGTIIFGTMGQPAAPPGTYTVTMTAGGERQSQTFRVLPDPRVSTSQADYIAQHTFLQEVGGMIDRLADQTGDLMSVRGQVEGLTGLADEAGLSEADAARVEEAGEALSGSLAELREDILQTANVSFYGPLENPGKLAADLAFLYNTVAGGLAGVFNARPTDQAVDRLQELQVDLAGVSNRLQTIFDEDLAAFNELIRSLGMDPVVLTREGRLIS